VLEEMRKKNVGLQERMEALEEEGKAAKTRAQVGRKEGGREGGREGKREGKVHRPVS